MKYVGSGLTLIGCVWLTCCGADSNLIRLGTIQVQRDNTERQGMPVRYSCNLGDVLSGKVAGSKTDARGFPEGYQLLLKAREDPDLAIPVQWDPATQFPWERSGEGALVWIMDSSPSGRVLDLVLKPGKAPSPFSIEQRKNSTLNVEIGGREVLQYNYGVVRQVEGETGPYDRAGYIHPVWTPKGQVITGDFSPEHIHQRGLFLAFRHVSFGALQTDFWGLGESSGRILPDEPGPLYSAGPVLAKLTIYNKGDVSGRTYMKEVWGVSVYEIPGGEIRLFDIVVRQFPMDPMSPDAPPAEPLSMVLERLHYGGMSFRGPSSWLHRDGAEVSRARSEGIKFPGIEWLPPGVELRVLTSEGKTRLDGDGESARWVDYAGPVSGGWAGLVIYSHPGNPRHPMPVRIHPELPYFSYALAQEAPCTVRSDRSLDQRFRVLVHDGIPNQQLNERFGVGYLEPVEVVFEPSKE